MSEPDEVSPKDHFRSPWDSKLKSLLITLIPLSVILKWNKWAFLNDSKLYALEEKFEKFSDLFSFRYTLNNFYNDWIRNLSVRIPRAWDYLKLSWRNNDWDYAYFLEVISFKLKRTEKCIRKYNRHVSTQDSCDQMKLASECLERFHRDFHMEMLFEELHRKFPEYEKNYIGRFLKGEREVSLTPGGKKEVLYSLNHNSRDKPEGYDQEFQRLNHYYSEARTAEFRVFCHIMTPGSKTYAKYLQDKETRDKIYEKYGYDGDAETHLPYDHSGIYSWWD